MRFLIMHVNSFCCTITTRGRSKVYEEYGDPVTRVDEALIVLASVEKGDERAPEAVARRTAAEIVKLATQLRTMRQNLLGVLYSRPDLTTPGGLSNEANRLRPPPP